MHNRRRPTLRLRRLAAEMRRRREEAGLTQDEVFERTSINQATLYRVENALSRPQVRTLRALLDLYGVNSERAAYLLTLLRESDQRGWLETINADLPERLTTYVELEDEARSVLNYESSFVPGLLQTEGYARAIIRGVLPEATLAEVDSRVEVRLRRQEVLTRESPIRLWAIVGEGALRHCVGGNEVMREQMLRLTEVANKPNITLQVLPFEAGAHPGMLGSFHVLNFGQVELPDVVYIDSMAGDLFLDGPADIDRYTVIFEYLRAIALSPEDSVRLITKLAEGG
ncbi:helix-turn-helix domain-containing protein [Actinoallomurus rhizosphaericola]|uniref:helix-turn-helix domain-containing protein n=1 Tax=Actinoallomurus rhizosphaericola TaxID=2952536 RepID=UPI002092DA5E|nr:helix-turn-helix transcriptional regulator [Actinoallomurus rhizosphaericola]MCO5996875.1 helix-turn-helix transcriptional regulator [Actinoallomurus rhizosphaericola]